MPQICSASVKEIVNQTLSDVIIDGVSGDFACLPSERTKLFAVPNGISLCSSEFIQGVLLGAGSQDASFIAYSIRVPILVTSVAPYLVGSDTGVNNFILGVNPTDMAAVMLLAELLITQMQISFLVQKRVQVCEFASQFPAGGGMWAALTNVSQICPAAEDTACTALACAPPLFVGTFNNGIPQHDNRFELTQPVGIGTGMSLGATIAFDNIANSNGECISVLDLLAQTGNTEGCSSTPSECPAGTTFQAAGIAVKADLAIDGLLCHAVC